MLNEKTLDRMRELTQIVGISGDEREVSRALAAYYQGLCDEIIYDNLGSVFAVKRCGKENARRVMVCAHMDEAGLMVTEIRDNGLASFIKIGPVEDQALYGQRVRIRTGKGEVAGTVVLEEERLKDCDSGKMRIDFGASSAKEAAGMGVHPGDSAVIDGPFTLLADGKRAMSKAWDNRFGCVLGIELLEAARDMELDFDLYVGASVMEQVGVRGATTATGLIQPDLGIVLDCSGAGDLDGKESSVGKLGAGVLVRYYDKGMMPNRGLLDELVEVCQREGIDYQYFYNMEQTDAAWIHKLFAGCPTLSICVCARNVHTGSAVLDLHDYECAGAAAKAVLKGLNEARIQYFKEYNR